MNDAIATSMIRQAGANGPWFLELEKAPSPAQTLACFSSSDHRLLLDSASRLPGLGRYSFFASEPFQTILVGPGRAAPFTELKEALDRYSLPTAVELPPFQGGAAGLWSYDLNRSLEQIAAPKLNDFETPAIAVGLYDTVVAWDHLEDRTFLIATGFPEQDSNRRREHAYSRIESWAKRLCGFSQQDRRTRQEVLAKRAGQRSLAELAPAFPIEGPYELYSNFSREEFLAMIRRGIEYIAAGDVFQVNLTHRLLSPELAHPEELYERLTQLNPAPFAGFFDLGQQQIISASPERLIQVRDRKVESRPIKGTTFRTHFPEADLSAAASLRCSEKDRAENVMIVDLLRNDLSRVCKPDSIHVTQLCQVETFEFVQHLVSAIEGQLRDECDSMDLLEAVFPGGSITGAPKIRAMELISELEPTPRGAYCGSLGYIGFGGTTDLNILIRTVTAQQGWWSFSVGGGIVSQSVPEAELEETWHKARGILRAIESLSSDASTSAG